MYFRLFFNFIYKFDKKAKFITAPSYRPRSDTFEVMYKNASNSNLYHRSGPIYVFRSIISVGSRCAACSKCFYPRHNVWRQKDARVNLYLYIWVWYVQCDNVYLTRCTINKFNERWTCVKYTFYCVIGVRQILFKNMIILSKY